MLYNPITSVHLNVTHRCNLACKYCYVQQEPLDMSWKVAKDSVDFLAKNSKETGQRPLICFFGGEPLLRYDDIIVPVVEYIKQAYPEVQFQYTITTNSVLLTEEKIKFFKNNKFGILTSIDGCPATQNYNRPLHGGKDSEPIVVPNIQKLLKSGFTPSFRSTIIPATCGNAYQDYLYAIDLNYKSMFAITNAYEKWDEEHEKQLEQEYYKIADHYIAYGKEHKISPIKLTMLNRYLSANMQNGKQKANNAKTHCGLGQSSGAAISPVGDIYGCQEMTSNEGKESIFYIGNIYDGTDDFLRKRLAEMYDSNKTNGDMPCEDCEANIVCNGGCVANNYMITGRLNNCPHGHCFFQRLMNKISKYIIENLKDVPEFINNFNKPAKHLTSKNAISNQKNKSCSNCDDCQVCDTCQVCDSKQT